MPRQSGAKNYNKTILFNVMNTILPTNSEEWKRVADLYSIQAQEPFVRQVEDIKRNWTEKCCNKFKKPTGESAPNDFVRNCQELEYKIRSKVHAGNIGGLSDSDCNGSSDSDAVSNHDECNSDKEDEDIVESSQLILTNSSNSDDHDNNTINSTSPFIINTNLSSVDTNFKKRKQRTSDHDSISTVQKSKNSKGSINSSNPRGGATKLLTNIADKITQSSSNDAVIQMLSTMVTNQQQQIQAMQQQIQGMQQQIQFIMQMMFMKNNNPSSSNSSADAFIPSFPSLNNSYSSNDCNNNTSNK